MDPSAPPVQHDQVQQGAYPPPQGTAYPPPQGTAYPPPQGTAYPPAGGQGAPYPPAGGQGAPYPPQQGGYPTQAAPQPGGPPPPYQYPSPQQPPIDQKAPLMVGQPQPGYPAGHTVIMNQPQQQPPMNTVVVQHNQPQQGVDSSTQGLAIASLVFAIIATCCVGAICCTIPAIVLAAIALGDSRKDNAKSMAVASCVLTSVAWVLYVVIIIWAVVANANTCTGYYC